jgi:hypothetical protein
MISSLEDAVGFFMYWKNERTLLHAMLSWEGIACLGTGYITECSEDGFAYAHADGDFELRIEFGRVGRAAFMTPEDFHGGKVRKGDRSVRLKHGWILNTDTGGFMNFFEEDTTSCGDASR